jgi:hypothetical protein
MNSQCENYELSFRQIKEELTDGSGSVCRVGFYAISYVLGVCSVGRLRCWSRRIQHPVLESMYQKLVELYTLLIPARTLPYEHTNSYRVVRLTQTGQCTPYIL